MFDFWGIFTAPARSAGQLRRLNQFSRHFTV
jgi:hypothetical protein